MFKEILPVLIGGFLSLIGGFLGMVAKEFLDRKKNLKEQAQNVGTNFRYYHNRFPFLNDYFCQHVVEKRQINSKELADFLYPKEINDMKMIISRHFKSYEIDFAIFYDKWKKFVNAYFIHVSSINKSISVMKQSHDEKEKITFFEEASKEVMKMSSIANSIYEENGAFSVFNYKVNELLEKNGII